MTAPIKGRQLRANRSGRSTFGDEIEASVGIFTTPLLVNQWYTKDAGGKVHISIPQRFGDGGVRVRNEVFRPAENQPVRGVVQGQSLLQYDYTPQQYASLIKLTATLCTVFPRITCQAPREADGHVIDHVLSDAQWARYQGLLGHYHVQLDKLDPGPAFNWDAVVERAKSLMSSAARAANQRMIGHPATPTSP